MSLTSLFAGLPAPTAYVLIGLLVMVESLGIPVPGETALVTGALLSAEPSTGIDVVLVGLVAFVGAVVGDTIGYSIGRRLGPSLFTRLGRRFPRHFSPLHIDYARHLFSRYGMGAVFGGRFIALLRILSGPLAGSLGMHYPRFLLANAAGGAAWAGGVTASVYLLGVVARQWVAGVGWVLLALTITLGVVASRVAGRAFTERARAYARDRASGEPDAAGSTPA